MRKRHLMIWSIMLVISLVALPALADDDTSWLLSFGTSLAAGETAIGMGGEPDPFACANVLPSTDYSYTDKIAGYTGLKHKKLGCSGETIDTFQNGGLCDYPTGSQLQQAKKFIRKHGDKIEFITIDIGANDVLPCFGVADIAGCAGPAIEHVRSELTEILSDLQDEFNAIDEDIPIIGMTYYNPYSPFFPITQPILDTFNEALRSVYLNPQFENVYLADVALPFNDPNAVLELTLIGTCFNVHPTDDGYWQIANTFLDLILDEEILDDWEDDDYDDDDYDDDDD